LREGWRKKAAPLLLAAAALGAYVALDSGLPHEREVTIVLGDRATVLRELELSWVHPREPTAEAALTTRWTFQKGAAPRRLHAQLNLPDGLWDAELHATLLSDEPLEHRTIRVNLEGGSWWKHKTDRAALVLSLDGAPQ